jgi:hypothetical protein
MKIYWKAIGLVAIGAVLYYPSMKLIQYLTKKRTAGNEEEDHVHHLVKAFLPAYRGKHKPHHRTAHNGQKDG